MTTPADPAPEPTPDGHTWLPQAYCQAQQMWGPPDPAEISPEWPAWQLPAWYAGQTGMVQIAGQAGQPGVYQYVWDRWLPWQSLTDRIDPATEWPDAARATAADMHAALFPAPDPSPAVAELPALPAAESAESETPAAPPTSAPTLGT
jgi:hypothetical protein